MVKKATVEAELPILAEEEKVAVPELRSNLVVGELEKKLQQEIIISLVNQGNIYDHKKIFSVTEYFKVAFLGRVIKRSDNLIAQLGESFPEVISFAGSIYASIVHEGNLQEGNADKLADQCINIAMRSPK